MTEEKSQNALRLVREYLETLASFINAEEMYPRVIFHLDAVILALLSKALRVGQAICLLVEHGFTDEAFGLSRTLLEVSLTIRYITNKESYERARRFVEYYAKDHAEWTRLIQKHYPASEPKYVPNHEELLEIATKYRSPHAWTGRGDQTSAMALESDEWEKDDSGQPVVWEFDYEVIYKWTSHFVHGTVVSLDAHALLPREPFKVFAGQDRIPKGEMALFNTMIYVQKAAICGLRALKTDFPADVVTKFETAKAIFMEGFPSTNVHLATKP
jgi:hypothetical protein